MGLPQINRDLITELKLQIDRLAVRIGDEFQLLKDAIGEVGDTVDGELQDKIFDGTVYWLETGLDFRSTVINYRIDQVVYQAPITDFTLSPADPTNPRKDVFAVTKNNTVIVIEGTPAPDPQEPPIIFGEQLRIGLVDILAAATEPANAYAELIYDENIGEPNEWTPSSTNIPPSDIDFDASVCGVMTGAKSINAKNLDGTLKAILFTNDALVDLLNLSSLTFQFKSEIPQDYNLVIWFADSATNIKIAVRILNPGEYGFNPLDESGTVQTISIPMSLFTLNNTPFDIIAFAVVPWAGSSVIAQGICLDRIRLLYGNGTPIEDKTFLGLTDTFNDYTGKALKALRVNANETAVETFDIPEFDTDTFEITSIRFINDGFRKGISVQYIYKGTDFDLFTINLDLLTDAINYNESNNGLTYEDGEAFFVDTGWTEPQNITVSGVASRIGKDPISALSRTIEYNNPIVGAEYTIDITANVLKLYKDGAEVGSEDLSLYLDDSNLARIVSGTVNPTTGIATITRDDASTFEIDFSSLIDTQPTLTSQLTNDGSDGNSTYAETDELPTNTSHLVNDGNGGSSFFDIAGLELNTEMLGIVQATTFTSGLLIVNGYYEIETYVAGDDFTNIGAASNATGVKFLATGTTPTTWTNGSTIVRQGVIDIADTEADQKNTLRNWMVTPTGGTVVLSTEQFDSKILNFTVDGNDLYFTAVGDYRFINSFGKPTSPGTTSIEEFHDYDGHMVELQFQQFAGAKFLTAWTMNGIKYTSGGSASPIGPSLVTAKSTSLKTMATGFGGAFALETIDFPVIEYIGGTGFSGCTLFTGNTAIEGELYLPELRELTGQDWLKNTKVYEVNLPKLERSGSSTWRNSKVTEFYLPRLKEVGTQDFYSMNAVSQTSGSLIVNRRYRISSFVAGDDFTNCGASSNTTGVIFRATRTAPTTWSNGSTLVRELVELDLPEVIIAGGTNGINCFSVATLKRLNAPKLRQVDDDPTTVGGVFANVANGCIINLHKELSTSNAGGIDADVVDAINNEGAIVNFFDGGNRIQEIGSMGFEENTTETSIATSDTYVKVAGTTVAGLERLFTHTTGKLEYFGGANKNFHISANFSMTSASSNQTITVKLHKNGSPIGYEVRRFVSVGSDVGAGSIAYDVVLDRGDYIELFVKNETSTGNVTIESLYLNVTENIN